MASIQVPREMDENSENDLDENGDEIDGFLTSTGKYNPRKYEVQNWGPDLGKIEAPENPHAYVTKLLRSTSPEMLWRNGVNNVVKKARTEEKIRRVLAFLHSNSLAGIRALNAKKDGAVVKVDRNFTLEYIDVSEWITILKRLHLELTDMHDIHTTKIKVGAETCIDTLKGFCYLLHAILDLSWTNLELVFKLGNDEGTIIYDMMEMLIDGSGIAEEHRPRIRELVSKYPSMMRSLGFQIYGDSEKLVWESPNSIEFKNLLITFHGCFRSATNTENIEWI